MSSKKQYYVKEIFGPTIQGESSWQGRPCVFVRFAGCNKWNGRPDTKEKSICSFCDTDFLLGHHVSSNEIVENIRKLVPNSKRITVILSGGEPFLQVDKPLLKALENNNIEIHAETNGSLFLPKKLLSYFSHIVCSPKQSLKETKLLYCDDLKLLFPWISEEITYQKFSSYQYKDVHIQPIEIDGVAGKKTNENIKKAFDFCVQNHLNLSVQLQKYILAK